MTGIPTIAAEEWNAVRTFLRRNRALRGTGVRFAWSPDGITIAAAADDQERHPWQLACSWRPDDSLPAGGTWVATVEPGFVNARDVTINTERDGRRADVALTDEEPPELVFSSFRNPAAPAGISATLAGQFLQSAGEGYPPFFEDLGVKPAAKAGPIGAGDPDFVRTRQIRACDVVLITPRIATRQTITVTDAAATGQTVDLGIEFVNAEIRGAPAHRLITTPRHTGPPEPTLAERLEGTAVEPQTDEIRIATVYFVSPPDAADDDEPDETWEAYPDYFVFRNLAHASRAQLPDAPPKPLQIVLPLVAGLAQPVVNDLLSLSNDALAAIGAFVGRSDFRGMYWAPGGLGFETENRPAPAASAPDPGGLDPATRRKQRQSQALAELADVPPLNPPFPYRKTPFDPFYFGLNEEPPAPA